MKKIIKTAKKNIKGRPAKAASKKAVTKKVKKK
jgi:hypothetical protein